jgi:hypothetical protein
MMLLCRIGIIALLVSCTAQSIKAPEDVEFRAFEMKASVINPKVPTKLWDKIEEQYNTGKIDEYSEELDRKKTKIDPPKKVYEMKVRMIEKNTGSLGGINYELDFGSSGNFIDLKDFLSNENPGSFFFDVDLEPSPISEDAVNKSFRVFHLSNAKKLKIAGEVSGGGCDEYRDITSYFLQRKKDGGLLVSGNDARHVSLLAGTFVFVAVENDTLYFSSLSITDSRFPNFICRK